MSEDIKKIIADAAQQPESETLNTDAIVDKTFTILDARTVESQFGKAWVVTIDLDGVATDAWLNGAVVDRQLTAIVEAGGLPVKVKMTRDDSRYGNPFVLEA